MRKLGVLALCALAHTLPAAAAAPAESRVLDERVARLEAQLQNQGLLNLLRQQEELRAEIARLRGAMEEYAHLIGQIEQRQKTLYQDTDARLKTLDAGLKEGLEGLEKRLNTQMDQRFSAVEAASKAAVKLKAADAIGAAAPVNPEQEDKSYGSALEKIRKGDYPAAIKAFEGFVRDYPESRRKGNALYWVGFAHFAQDEHKKVVAVLQRLLDELPEDAKVPDAMLTLARSKAQLKDPGAARKLIDDLIKRFPNNKAVSQARKLRATLD